MVDLESTKWAFHELISLASLQCQYLINLDTIQRAHL